ncbi:LysM peptidoglycan-binding domain-containing protein [Pontibacillus yanchengensis]|uniref:LysM peptidoglycan-binding domain-containing protein n=1 Tax=Pontibacillus yanchengensis TaxID=462910 RepID=A0A6I5A6M7_9BACI|nr:LysM peptidoglycan-binding domain-containing protein [Pontibacillus yanchengensis]MYL36055.1 LysM peptidoglycan-binding domain-containing protein [Pontibacillus yanchengensis]
MQIHVVQTGESLWSIAQRYQTTIQEIVDANELSDPSRLVFGLALIISSYYRSHTVQAGETLWSIAQQYNISLPSLIQANQLQDVNVIYPGTTLSIPPQTYLVQPSDTLWSISNAFGISVQTLVEANQIDDPNLLYPGTRLIIPSQTKSTIEVNGYTIDAGEDARNIMEDVGESLTYIMPFAYKIQEDGSLTPFSDDVVLEMAPLFSVVPILSITNFTYQDLGSDLANTILNDASLQNTLLDNILAILNTKGYQGLNVDFENVLPEDREAYNAFLQRAVDRLHPEGYSVSTAVAPKYSADQQGLLYEAHDYEAHGRIVDFVVLMTYEWGYRFGPPRAISPLDEIRNVLDYAVNVIPRDKLFMGFQLYARDWTLPFEEGQEAETFSPQEAVNRALQYGATIQYNESAQSPFYRYVDSQGQTHEVWFEDARSAQAKFNTVIQYDLKGISYWVLGYDFPQNWLLLNDTFKIVKNPS